MGRPSKLTEQEWAAAVKRVTEGAETLRAVAADVGTSIARLHEHVSKHKAKIERAKRLANQLVSVEDEIRSLPVPEQVSVSALANELRAISMHLASAGKYGAATAHRLSAIAHGEAQKIDDAAPLSPQSVEAIKGIAVLTKTANGASEIALNLLAANKETVKGLNEPDEKPLSLEDLYGRLAQP